MIKVYCTLITPATIEKAKELNKSPEITNNLISYWKTVKQSGNDPTIEDLRNFIQENESLLEELEYAIPYYTEGIPMKQGKSLVTKENNTFKVNTFNSNYTIDNYRNQYGTYSPKVKEVKNNTEAYIVELWTLMNISNGLKDYSKARTKAAEKLLNYRKKLGVNEITNDILKGNAHQYKFVEPVEITYTIGNETQKLTVKGTNIYNQDGNEVYTEDSIDRNKIFANVAVKTGRAVIVNYRGTDYIVNNKNQIMSTSKSNSGKVLNYNENHPDRKAIIDLALKEFKNRGINNETIKSSIKQNSNTYEVSTAGDKRFSALNARFKKGTIIDSVDVSGMSIEDVYQKIIKKSSKGKAPSIDSIINPLSTDEQGHPLWVITPEMPKDLVNKVVEYSTLNGKSLTKEELEDFSYYEGYLPLWQEWAKQNPELIEDLRQKSAGKTLVDSYTDTKVNQARALTDILKNTSKTPIFDSLPSYTGNTMTYAGIGSRETPKEIKDEMTKLATKLEGLGYTLNTGTVPWNDDGADQAFARGTNKKNLFGPEKANDTTRAIAKEIHPMPERLKGTGLNLMARNTNQVFGENLDTPVDFVIAWTKDGIEHHKDRTIQSGGTGQAISMASLKGIPVINMANPNWEQKLEEVLSGKDKEAINNPSNSPISQQQTNQPIQTNQQSTYTEMIDVNPPSIGSTVLTIDKESPRVKLLLDFTPNEIYDRTDLIARDFSKVITNTLNEMIEIAENDLVNASGLEKFKIQEVLHTLKDPLLGRREALNKIGMNQAIELVKSRYAEWLEMTEEELDEDYGEGKGKQILEGYNKILNNFDLLFNEALPIIENNESFRVDNSEELDDDEEGHRVNGSEGYTFKIRFIEPHKAIRAETRRALSDIVKILPNGDPATDNLGNVKYEREGYIHAVLINELSHMIDPDDFSQKLSDGTFQLMALERIASKYPWVNQIINKLQAEPNLISIFYNDFRKEFVSYWMQADNKSISLNDPLVLESTMETVNQNYGFGTILSNMSIYNEDLTTNKKHSEELIEYVDDVIRSINELDITEEDEVNEVINGIKESLNAIGFNSNISNLSNILERQDGLKTFKEVLRTIKDIANKAKDLEKGLHLVDTLKREYESIATIIGEVSELSTSMTFRQNGNSYPSYAAPNFIEILFKTFKNDDRRQDFIKNSFKKYDWFYNKETGEYMNEWVRLIETNESIRKNMSLKNMKAIGEVDYENWTPSMIKGAFVKEYFSIKENKGSDTQYAYYNFPIFSDSGVSTFIKFVKYTDNYKETLLPLLNKVVRQELDRIRLVTEREKKGVTPIDNYDERGKTFCFFPELNNKYVDGMKFIDKITQLQNEKDLDAINETINNMIMEIMNENYQNFLNNHSGMLFNDTYIESLINDGVAATKEGVIDKYEEYFWNSVFATTQIIQLTVTDLAFYKDGTDFQKRYKEVYASGTKLNTNSKYGRKIETTIYLEDKIVTSSSYTNLKRMVDKAYKDGRISKMDKDSILYKFKDINATDSQAYRSESSYKAVLDMMGNWTPDVEDALERFKNDGWNMGDFNLIFQTLKPFFFGYTEKPDGISDDGRIKVGHQNKNSEFLLLATYNVIANAIGKSGKLKGLNRFMEDYNIDVAQFRSAVKAGGQGPININNSPIKVKEAYETGKITVNNIDYRITGLDKNKAPNFDDIKEYFDRVLSADNMTQDEYNDVMEYFEPTEQEVYDILVKATTTTEDNPTDKLEYESERGRWYNSSTVHFLKYDDYMIAQPTPEHLFDVMAVYGSQFRNLIVSDLPSDMTITVNGQVIKGKENILRMYQNLIVENLLEDYEKLTGTFQSIETLQARMMEMIKGNPKYGRDMLDALSLVDYNGNKVFNIPLHNPTTTLKIQELINSMFKNAITKQSIKGGACILVSNFGFTEELQLLRNEDGSIKGAECYMPFYTKKHFEKFLKPVKKNGNILGYELDVKAVEKQDPDLLKMIGYRIPTEGKYSMMPLIIKGFLPQQNGSSIMLPADLTTIAGSDKVNV